MPTQPTLYVRLSLDTTMSGGDEIESDEDDDEVEKINDPIISQCEPSKDSGLVKIETSNERLDDVRIKGTRKFIFDKDFIKTSKF